MTTRGFQKGRISNSRGQGEGLKWIMQHRNYERDDCLFWPLYKNKNGRGFFGFTDDDGKKGIKHAPHFMCELVHGPKPSPKHLAVVICEGRQQGCCNPRHIAWRTKSEETLERYKTKPCENITGNRPKHSADKIQKIKLFSEQGMSKVEISQRLVMPYSTVDYWVTRRLLLGHHQGPLTRRRALGIQPVSLLKSQRTICSAEDTYRIVNSIVPRGALAREDAINDIMVAILDGRTTLDRIRKGEWRKFTGATLKTNFEMSGQSLSLDVPMFDGRSWHDVLPENAGFGSRW